MKWYQYHTINWFGWFTQISFVCCRWMFAHRFAAKETAVDTSKYIVRNKRHTHTIDCFKISFATQSLPNIGFCMLLMFFFHVDIALGHRYRPVMHVIAIVVLCACWCFFFIAVAFSLMHGIKLPNQHTNGIGNKKKEPSTNDWVSIRVLQKLCPTIP